MTFVPPTRNTAGIQWAEIRARADAANCEMSDEVSAAYYDYWQHGLSSPWGPFDTVGDPEGDERQFGQMQAMIYDMGVIMFHKINHRMNQLGEPGVIAQDDYRYEYDHDDEGNVIDTFDTVMFSKDRLAVTMQELGTVSAKQMMDHYRQRIADMNGPDYDFPDWDVP